MEGEACAGHAPGDRSHACMAAPCPTHPGHLAPLPGPLQYDMGVCLALNPCPGEVEFMLGEAGRVCRQGGSVCALHCALSGQGHPSCHLLAAQPAGFQGIVKGDIEVRRGRHGACPTWCTAEP